MALTDTAIRTATAGAKDRKLAEEKGLYLLVTAGGSKLWRFKFRIDGKEQAGLEKSLESRRWRPEIRGFLDNPVDSAVANAGKASNSQTILQIGAVQDQMSFGV